MQRGKDEGKQCIQTGQDSTQKTIGHQQPSLSNPLYLFDIMKFLFKLSQICISFLVHTKYHQLFYDPFII